MIKMLVVAGITVSVIIFIFIILFIKEVRDYHKMGKENTQIVADDNLIAVEDHLESKYGEKFIINPNWKSIGGGSPIPFSENDSPIYYEVHTETDPDFGFRVYMYPMSDKNSDIKEIRDSYCWKFFREQIREYFENKMEGMIPQDYKLVVNVNPNITFANSITQYSSTESYFRFANRKVSLRLYLILNDVEPINQELLRDKLYEIIKEFYEKYDENMYINLICFRALTQDDFIMLDERKKENTVLVNLEDFPSTKNNSWGVNLEKMFTIHNFAYKSNGGKKDE